MTRQGRAEKVLAPDADAAPPEQLDRVRPRRTGLQLDLVPALAGELTQADLVRQAVQLQAAARALNAAKKALYEHGFARHVQRQLTQGAGFNVPVAGFGTAYVPGGKRVLVATDTKALVAWLDEHHGGQWVVRTPEAHVTDASAAVAAHERLEAWLEEPNLDAQAGLPASDLDDLLRLVADLLSQLVCYRAATPDLAALAKGWKARTATDPDDLDGSGLPVDPNGEPVPHLRWTTTPHGSLTVRPEPAHIDALALQYAQALGLPRPVAQQALESQARR